MTANETVAMTPRECIDVAIHFANGNTEGLCAVFTVAYLRDNPALVSALEDGGDARSSAMEIIETAFNAFMGTEDLIKLKDTVNV